MTRRCGGDDGGEGLQRSVRRRQCDDVDVDDASARHTTLPPRPVAASRFILDTANVRPPIHGRGVRPANPLRTADAARVRTDTQRRTHARPGNGRDPPSAAPTAVNNTFLLLRENARTTRTEQAGTRARFGCYGDGRFEIFGWLVLSNGSPLRTDGII